MGSSAARASALAYHQRGWCPIPVKDRSKQTALVQLAPYLSRRATKEELASWSWPGVGIVTGPLSGLLVLDVDGPEGEVVLKEHGHPITPMVRTGSGGLHLYLRHPDTDVRTGIRIAPGLDVKASGGYVVAPPSIGPSGDTYEWIVRPEEAEPADVPEWLMKLIEQPRRNGLAPPVEERVPSGQRNRELTSLAGSMRRRGMGEAEIRAALEVTNTQRCDPPLEDEEVEKIAASVSRYEPASTAMRVSLNGRGTVTPSDRFNPTDLGNAERFVAQHGGDVRYCYPWAKWLLWTGARWERDEAGGVHRLGKETVRSIYREAAAAEDEDRRKALAQHATRSEAEAKIKAMLELAKSEVPVSPDELDTYPWLLNAPNGTVDLRTGELRSHRREDLLTKMAGCEYRADAAAPVWAAFLERVLPGEALRGFVRRAAGYSATGVTSEQCMFINHGIGANGKTTFQEAFGEALGDYAMRTPTETLLTKRSGGVPNDVARLKGARCVSAAETGEGRRLDESLVKDLTGQDTVTARFMRAEWFDFKPSHKLWLSTNHKPEIRGTDNAIWRRIRLIPWSVVISPADQDRKLPVRLRAELVGILAWAVQGCLEWGREGLQAPEEVRQATQEYRAEMDVLAAFLADCCEREESKSAYAGKLWEAWRRWCDASGEQTGTQKRFGGRLSERGFLNRRDSRTGRKMWVGLSLRADWEARAELSLTHAKIRFAGDSEPTEPSDPKTTITASKTEPREVMRKDGSVGSVGSTADASPEPFSFDLEPGESALLSELREDRQHAKGDFCVEDVIEEFKVPSSNPAHNVVRYHEERSDQRLLWLTRSVVMARDIPTEEAEQHLPVVEAAAMRYLADVAPE